MMKLASSHTLGGVQYVISVAQWTVSEWLPTVFEAHKNVGEGVGSSCQIEKVCQLMGPGVSVQTRGVCHHGEPGNVVETTTRGLTTRSHKLCEQSS